MQTETNTRNPWGERSPIQLPCAEEDLAAVFAAADSDGSGVISFSEYAGFCSAREGALSDIYKSIDANNDGMLTVGVAGRRGARPPCCSPQL